ncbi:hypothetical protein N7468_008693 [Penicillium chermesinum]|uniref:Uncharacterized protein n=1 Tax=Penicillium chermesinum TaxID=63820 RepID=A0A9W9TIK2_9EURO|nr:uncharacterized protein N7468_008693 [Penicillium chermesinum]KAJ5224151.1 hypothetical protein N7468_008693 [Penicillium chermesinum]
MEDELATLFNQQMSMRSLPSQPEPQPISYSISQHYHHSSHVASIPSHQIAPDAPANDSTSGIMEILWQHGIDPSSLSPSQLDLFKHADLEQKQRLVQTWQVYMRSTGPLSESTNSTCDSEDLDMNVARDEAEPYMRNGYEPNALPIEPTTGRPYASAKDPVYNSRHWWETAHTAPIESQYGAFEEMNRCY